MMAINIKSITGVIPGLQATALAMDNVKFMDLKKKSSTKKVVKQGVKNLVGISLLKPTAKIINDL